MGPDVAARQRQSHKLCQDLPGRQSDLGWKDPLQESHDLKRFPLQLLKRAPSQPKWSPSACSSLVLVMPWALCVLPTSHPASILQLSAASLKQLLLNQA